MRYVGDLITAARKPSANLALTLGTSTSVIEDVSEGIGDQTILEYMNEAQDHLQAVIVNLDPADFLAEKIIDVVAGQEEYTINDQLFAGNRIKNVEYSYSGQLRDYCDLPQRSIRDRNTDTDTDATFYIRRNGKVLLNPIPRTGRAKIRVNYFRELDDLQVRAGQIDSVTESSGEITALSLDISDDNENILSNSTDKFVTIVDKEGSIIEYNVAYTDYNTSTGDLTLDGNHTRTGTTTITTSHYVVVGKYTTTHSGLPDNAERYLITHAIMRILQQDSSQDWRDIGSVLGRMESDIVDTFGDTEDVQEFPVKDWDAMF